MADKIFLVLGVAGQACRLLIWAAIGGELARLVIRLAGAQGGW